MISITSFIHIYRLASNFMLLFASGIIGTSLVNLTHYYHVPGNILPDRLFDIIPELSPSYEHTSDIILLSSIAIIITIAILTRSPSVRNKFLTDFSRMATISILWKGLVGFWTSLPGPAPHCRFVDKARPTTIVEVLLSQV